MCIRDSDNYVKETGMPITKDVISSAIDFYYANEVSITDLIRRGLIKKVEGSYMYLRLSYPLIKRMPSLTTLRKVIIHLAMKKAFIKFVETKFNYKMLEKSLANILGVTLPTVRQYLLALASVKWITPKIDSLAISITEEDLPGEVKEPSSIILEAWKCVTRTKRKIVINDMMRYNIARKLSLYLWAHWKPFLDRWNLSRRDIEKILKKRTNSIRKWAEGLISWDELVEIVCRDLEKQIGGYWYAWEKT